MSKLYFCTPCQKYTMHTKCPACSKPVALAKPPKYSPEDRWGDYRRRAQQEESAE